MAGENGWDVVVIGAGHAGCEAALSAARMGCATLMLTLNLDTIGQMSCNPAVGGTAKGHLVREIDALGGEMGRVTDLATIQFRVLNASRGPAVRSSRAQCDRARYRAAMKRVVEHTPNLDVRQCQAARLIVEGGRVVAVEDVLGVHYRGRAVIVTAGTFLRGLIHVGLRRQSAGRSGEVAATDLSESLASLGLTLGRLKTGTSPRLRASSIDYERLEAQRGDPEPWPFHWAHRELPLRQVACHITHTTAATHEVIRRNLDRSPLYSGVIEAAGVRYCPSVEDKVLRFPERDRHQVILEPDGLDTEEVYANGISTSLPVDVQEDLVHSIPGLERAEIMRPGYAIEYDFVPPIQLTPTLETRPVAGLYLAGQINGTTGYEEAAALGFWAGVNAACAIRGLSPFLPDRSEAYMAVMVDDLVTRGTVEPYRMFTSRAEYRLLLREDNADLRLAGHGRRLGLVSRGRFEEVEARRVRVEAEIERLSASRVAPSATVNDLLVERGARPLAEAAPLRQLLRRPELTYADLARLLPGEAPVEPLVARQVEVAVKYEGYISRMLEEVARFRQSEAWLIPAELDYAAIAGLSTEVRERLGAIRPRSLGQAARVPGVTPAAISILMVWCHREKSQ
ncbi:MAG TPA: tRNA uridine-5-carboxymethylaminomethyl(34) synthesis enzyme MnmG [Candidatus Methylomirabilis sp.]|nr:tRNA uridine-5-carboxymethylaminomethyl(34) synthesis enzyme MnmG [Candidatus Methylomirabilis sp.]